MVDVSGQDSGHARLCVRARRIDNGAACVLLVIRRDDGWSLHGLDLPGQVIHVPDDSMAVLANSIVHRSRS